MSTKTSAISTKIKSVVVEITLGLWNPIWLRVLRVDGVGAFRYFTGVFYVDNNGLLNEGGPHRLKVNLFDSSSTIDLEIYRVDTSRPSSLQLNRSFKLKRGRDGRLVARGKFERLFGQFAFEKPVKSTIPVKVVVQA